MKKYRILSLFHQFFKELKTAQKKGKSPIVPFKYIFTYLMQNRIKRDRLNEKVPWMTIPAVKILKSYTFSGINIFEYGSGASTLFFGSKGANVISIEHDKIWLDIIKNKIYQEKLNNVSIYLEEPRFSSALNGIYSKKDKNYLQCDYSDYVNSISKFDDKYFDIIVIDGRVRVACLEVSLSKLKKDGLLVFDNGDREEYQNALNKLKANLILSEYTISSFDLAFSQTNIYKLS